MEAPADAQVIRLLFKQEEGLRFAISVEGRKYMGSHTVIKGIGLPPRSQKVEFYFS